MTTTFESFLSEEDYVLSMEEMHYHSIVNDSAEAIDKHSAYNFLIDVCKRVDNPQEQHLINQLVLLLEHYEGRLLSITPANKLLTPSDELTDSPFRNKRKQWWE